MGWRERQRRSEEEDESVYERGGRGREKERVYVCEREKKIERRKERWGGEKGGSLLGVGK